MGQKATYCTDLASRPLLLIESFCGLGRPMFRLAQKIYSPAIIPRSAG